MATNFGMPVAQLPYIIGVRVLAFEAAMRRQARGVDGGSGDRGAAAAGSLEGPAGALDGSS